MTSSTPIAFFGATGGCALNALVLALQDGYHCIALARTPSKLTKLLNEAPHSISQSKIDSHLEIIAGDINNIDSMKPMFKSNPKLIISGIGSYPKFTGNPISPFKLEEPICTNFANNLVSALKQLKSEGKLTTKPLFSMIGTTGISKTRDVPYLMLPLYKVMLASPHEDKEAAEEIVIKATQEASPVFSGYTFIHASLLLDGESRGSPAVRTGWERHALDAEGSAGPGNAIGYTIRRADVGVWIFENLIKGNASDWNRRCASITY